ncbi:MAG TPA: c-type cytochrome, partial [bacterium]|nr:c-type cytochrome [bacterium]
CHAINGKGKQIGPDLQELEWGYSVTEIAGLMWNHGGVMREYMKTRQLRWPEFTGKEMADLIAYLYFFRFADETGNPQQGKLLYSQKQCAQCHENNTNGTRFAPDLSGSSALSSSINFAQIMWNHAPAMEEKMSERVVVWPEFTGKEMRDLYIYLREHLKSETMHRKK